jgi:soluble lytic murein transglycosylase-like protein
MITRGGREQAMNGVRFDRLARGVAGARSRRWALRALLGGVALGTLRATAAPGAARREWRERQIIRIIHKAADRYDQPRKDMVRVARCESNLDPYARNPAGPYLGLFQFLRSTWKTTPYRDEDIFDPKANALAAAWMWKKGRRDEWACQ